MKIYVCYYDYSGPLHAYLTEREAEMWVEAAGVGANYDEIEVNE